MKRKGCARKNWRASELESCPTNGCLGPRLSLDVVCAGVLFETLVRKAIEGERDDGADAPPCPLHGHPLTNPLGAGNDNPTNIALLRD